MLHRVQVRKTFNSKIATRIIFTGARGPAVPARVRIAVWPRDGRVYPVCQGEYGEGSPDINAQYAAVHERAQKLPAQVRICPIYSFF